MNTEPYIRRKGDKFVIEQKLDGKTKYLRTLPDAQTLLDLLNSLRPDGKGIQASRKEAVSTEKAPEEFAQEKLPELQQKDATEKKKHIPTQEELELLWKITKE